MTVLQHLVYASRFKNSNSLLIGNAIELDHEKRALELLQAFAFGDIADSKVEKCSGGEQKRLALALELIAVEMPNLVIFDEPTSGLDSNTAEKVL